MIFSLKVQGVSNTKVRVLVVRHIEEDALDLLSEKIGLPIRAENSQLNLFSLQLVDPRNIFCFLRSFWYRNFNWSPGTKLEKTTKGD